MEENKFTLENVRQFMIEQGGICSNHVLVAKFKHFLSHSVYKLENRNKLKEFVQLLTAVETRNGEKVLVLKKRYKEQGCFNLIPNMPEGESVDESASNTSVEILKVPEIFNPTFVESQQNPPESSIPQASKRKPRQPSFEEQQEGVELEDFMAGSSSLSIYQDHPPVEPLKVEPQPDLGFYSSLVDRRTSAISKPFTNYQPEIQDDAPTSSVDGQMSEESSTAASVVSNPVFSTPEPSTYNSDSLKKTPISAKDRIKQFDQITTDHPAPTARRSNKESRHHAVGQASQNNNSEVSDYESYATVSLTSKEKEWMLTSSSCDYHTMCKLLQEQPDLAHRRDFISGYNAMHWAAKHGKSDVIKLLNGYQVEANVRSFCGYTPLHLAAIGGNEECIDLLVNLCKVTPNTRDFYGRRPKQYLKKNCSTRIQQMLQNSARQSLSVGYTVDDVNSFARTQSFSAKIMKTTQGLARKFSSAARGSSENFRDINEDPDDSPQEYRKSLRNFQIEETDPSLVENYAMSRSESAPEIPPPAESQTSLSG